MGFKDFRSDMITRIVLIFTLQITYFVPDGTTQSGTVPCILCSYSGSFGNTSYTFSVSDALDRCDAFWYGYYILDTPFNENDKKAINDLVALGKPVYVSVVLFPDTLCIEIMSSPESNSYDKAIEQMETFLTDNKITGIILENLNLFGKNITNFPEKLNTFICNIKAKVPKLKKVGILVSGIHCDLYGYPDIFDFSITNSMVDIYVIDTTGIGPACNPGVVSRWPITSKDPTEANIEEICQGVTVSGMDPNKLMINLIVVVNKYMDDSAIIPYSEYCKKAGTERKMCADSIEILYNAAKYAKPYFKGFMLSYLDSDDYDESCGCGKFPVTNNYINAWQSLPMNCCAAISGN